LFGQMTVLQNVLVGRHRSYRSNLLDVMLATGRFRRDEVEQTERARQLLGFVGLGEQGRSRRPQSSVWQAASPGDRPRVGYGTAVLASR